MKREAGPLNPLESGAGRPRRLARSIGAVVVGLLAIFVLSVGTDVAMHLTGVFPPVGRPMAAALWGLATAYRIVYGVAGCAIAARLAPNRPMAHALALGIVGVVLSTVGAVIAWNRGPALGPAWFPLSLIGISLPCAWLGGKLELRRTARHGVR